ncbi:MAG: SprT family zinc-dependent metalloprotease [Prochlorococcaceae cyanobacterium]
MPIEPLLPLFHRLDREHFGGSLAPLELPRLVLRWSDGRMTRTAGLYRRGPGISEIVLSRPLLEPLPREALLGTLAHEMIHAWIDRVLRRREVHGPHFRSRMAAINAAQSSFEVRIRHSYPLPQGAAPTARWLARCQRCGSSTPYRRRVSGLACRACCQALHGGRWHASCLLEFVEAA